MGTSYTNFLNYSLLFQVLETTSSKLMAMKFVNLALVEENIAGGYLNEIDVLSKLQGCPSVIRMFDRYDLIYYYACIILYNLNSKSAKI